jgi:hypothetical protein
VSGRRIPAPSRQADRFEQARSTYSRKRSRAGKRVRFHLLLSRIVNRSDVTLPPTGTLCALAFPPGTREHAGKFEDS